MSDRMPGARDLIRNDLSIIAEQVQVKRYRYIDHLTTNKGEILQTSSEITGQLPADYRENIGTLLFHLLPAGSITGAPKPRTMEIIDAAEGYERDFYTGVMGCYSKGQLDSAVMIRFIDKDKDLIYGIQNDKLFRLNFMPKGGIRMAETTLKENGYEPDSHLHEIFTKYVTTVNDGIFRAYTQSIRKARHSHVITGLPDALK